VARRKGHGRDVHRRMVLVVGMRVALDHSMLQLGSVQQGLPELGAGGKGARRPAGESSTGGEETGGRGAFAGANARQPAATSTAATHWQNSLGATSYRGRVALAPWRHHSVGLRWSSGRGSSGHRSGDPP
jgi:hypothetical protein